MEKKQKKPDKTNKKNMLHYKAPSQSEGIYYIREISVAMFLQIQTDIYIYLLVWFGLLVWLP